MIYSRLLQDFTKILITVYAITNPSYITGVPKLSVAMCPFSIWIDEHVTLKLFITERVRKISKNVNQ